MKQHHDDTARIHSEKQRWFPNFHVKKPQFIEYDYDFLTGTGAGEFDVL